MQGTQQLVLHGHGAVGCIHPLDVPVWAPIQKILDAFILKDLSAKTTHPATYQNIVTWTFA